MNDTSSENPTSGLMATSGASPAIQALQRIKDLVFQAAAEFGEIESPETAHEENIAKVNALLQERFHLLRDHRGSGDEQTIQDEIVQYAGDKKILEIYWADAEKEYTSQIETVLQRLCDQLTPAMGSAVVKRSLQKLPTEKLKHYLPDNLLISNDGAATELETVP
ncbi:hypothetical protein MGU_10461 [Metarhizium guizhouense ARSEF 977]|uniref:Uncharacterized protein n=1 Tax=Metarhizium guizhouense (strain ARSEF 977) TaxID=1276136 RepID=A0A0B4GI88_METGA|nr:hypothetical protein MGU_10461 [Metarhizium guizhouense ARSEF 977]